MSHTTIIRARMRPRVPLLTPFYVLVLARGWRDEVTGGELR